MPRAYLYADRPADRAAAARAVDDGAVVATAFGNFYALVAEPSPASVRRVNLAKGRPGDQVGSIATPVERIPALFDFRGLPRDRLQAVVGAFAGAGPIGFRGPARAGLPDHLTRVAGGVRTAQVISPGTACPANDFFARCAAGLVYVTSANRSRHVTGAGEEPAHWTADGIAAELGHLPGLIILAHRDEGAARAAYPHHLPMSVTVLAFPAAGGGPVLTVERHGSLHVDQVRAVAGPYGFDVRLGPAAGNRLAVRSYAPVPG